MVFRFLRVPYPRTLGCGGSVSIRGLGGLRGSLSSLLGAEVYTHVLLVDGLEVAIF